jgi:hypothetical protein
MLKHIARILAMAIVLTLGLADASGQCLDWADGFAADEFGCDGEIRAMVSVEEDGQTVLYVGGVFSRIGGIDADSLARWDGSDWSEVGGGVDGIVEDIEFYVEGSDTTMFVGGHFYEVGEGQPIQMLARYADGQWSEVGGAALTNPVQAMAVHDGMLFIGGRFSEIGGHGTQRLAAWDGIEWQTYASGPDPRDGHSMAYDQANGYSLLFGGDELPNGIEQQDTWSYDGQSWELLAWDGPERRLGHTMTYDTLRNRVLMFGGQPRGWGGGTDTRLWAWDGSMWGVVADVMPVYRKQVTIAYDATRDRVVWFGGATSSTSFFDDTWEYDGTEWVEVIPATTRPAARANYALAYDAARQEVVLFGGYGYNTGTHGDTWAWDGVDWTLVADTGPSPRYGHEMVYDSTRQQIVMYGGRGDSGWAKDTWGWDGTQWSLLAATDPSRPDDSHGPMAYDPQIDRVVMRDELGVTWLWDGTDWENINEGGLDAEVFALASFDDGTGADLYVGGYFTHAGSISAARVARLTADGWQTVGGGIQENWCSVLYVWDDGGGDDLYIGGAFGQADNQAMQSIGRWDGSAWSLLNVGDPADGGGIGGAVHSMFAYDDGSGEKLYVGGNFDLADGPDFGSIEARNIASWDGAVWEAVGGHINPQGSGRGVFALAPMQFGGESRLGAGGNFDTAGGKPAGGLALWGEPCMPPLIVDKPVDVIAVELEPVVFSVRAWGTRPLGFQWRRDGIDLQNDSRIAGATTTMLVIDPWVESDQGVYDIVATNSLGSATSDPAGLTTFPGGGSGGVVMVSPVLIPPEPCPWDENAVLESVGGGTSSRTGEGVFHADSSANGIDAVFRWSGGAYEPIVKVGDTAPGTGAGVFFGNYQNNLRPQAFVSRGGALTILASLSGDDVTQNDDVGVWRAAGSQVDLIVREGDPAPGFPAGITIDGNYSGEAELQAQGSRGEWMTFRGALEGGEYDPAFDRAIWRWSAEDEADVVVQRYTPAPVIGTNILDIWAPAHVDSSGNALVALGLESHTGYSNSSGWDSGLFFGAAGEFTIPARSGDPAPGFDAEVNIDSVNGGRQALLSDAGHVVFSGKVAGPNGFGARVLYEWHDGVLTPLAIQGQAAPDIPNDLPYFSAEVHALNDLGDAAFTGGLNNNGCNGECPSSAFFIAMDGEVTGIIYRYMSPLPGLGETFVYDETSLVAINNQRQMIFEGGVRLNSVLLSGVFGWHPDHGMFPIAVPGSQLEIAPDDVRVVVEAHLSYINIGVSATNLREAGISDDGLFLFRVGFSDGTQGLLEGDFVDFLSGYFPCVADFNDDGNVNTLDVLAFLNAWSAGDSSADINEDGDVNTLDVLAFLNLWSAGC